MRTPVAILAVALLGGCTSGPAPAPGSERVVLTQNPADVAGAELVGSISDSQGNARDVAGALVWARNYVASTGGDVGLYRIEPGTYSRVISVSSYRR